ncbi:MAG: glycosyltransferase family 4 protein [Parcubacteria group bacterium]|nr:glycosyltransferase family 4 protein [Parcubacteria group bacterium]
MYPKKKILYLVTKSNQGGAQRNVYDLATDLSPANFDVLICAGGEGWLLDELNKKNIRAESLPFLSRDINILADLSVFFRLIALFKKERPDVVHLHSSKVGGLGAFAARVSGVPKIIFTAHGWAFNEPRFFLSRAMIWLASCVTALLSHHLITITKKDTAQARAMPFVSKSKINYIPNGIGEIKFLPREMSRETLLSSLAKNLSPETLWIGAISELTKNKGLSYAIDAIANLLRRKEGPFVKFVFVIIGEGEERKALEKQIADNNLSNTVFLVGHKKDARILLKAFDIFTLTSLKEGLPYALLEAGLAGLPVVASNVGGIPDIIDNNAGILVPTKNPEAIAEALQKMIQDAGLRHHCGAHNAKKISNTHSLRNMLNQTTALYK